MTRLKCWDPENPPFPSRIQRQLLAVRNPVAVTLYCNLLMQAIVEGLFGFRRADWLASLRLLLCPLLREEGPLWLRSHPAIVCLL
jgi:hypothetical protein